LNGPHETSGRDVESALPIRLLHEAAGASGVEHPMKYLCLAYENEALFHDMSAADWDGLRTETLAYVDQLQASGHLVLTNALKSANTAAIVRVRSGRLSVTDGPFAETKEQIGGFFLIEARDLNEAIQLASRWPSARLGSIEVRPVEAELPIETRYI
jgi:hypothetical protein